MKMSGRLLGAVFLVFGFGFWPASLLASPVWSTGFEGGVPTEAVANGNWHVVTSDQAAHSGTKGLDISGATTFGGDVLAFDLSSAGFTGLIVNFWSKVRGGLESVDGDSVRLEWSPNDGTDWEPLTVFSGLAAGDWFPNQFSLPPSAGNNPNLELRLVATLGTSGDRMAFDDFSLSGVSIPEPITIGLLAFGVLITAAHHRRFA